MTEPGPHPDPFEGPEWADETEGPTELGAEPPARRRRTVSLRRLRRRRWLGLVMVVLGALILVSYLWLAVTALMARSQLETVRHDVHRLRAEISAGNLSAAKNTARDIRSHAARAHDLTTGPVWAVAANLPGGAPVATVRVIAREVDVLGSRVLPRLIAASDSLDPHRIRRADGSFDVGQLAKVAPVLDGALRTLGDSQRAVQRQPAHTWLGTVDSARRDLLGQLDGLEHTLHSADLASHIAPAMLGQQGTKRYFVAFQNNAEARGTGGLPGAFAIASADHGKLKFERFESDSALNGVKANVRLGPDYDRLFNGNRSTTFYPNTNLSPHFPYAAQIWMSMWKRFSGQTLDGAIAIDPQALAYLLQVTGPTTLRDGTRVTGNNVVALTESTVYQRFPAPGEKPARLRYLLELARRVSNDVMASRANPTSLIKAAGRAAGERRILVYSADPRVEAQLEQTSLAGIVPQTKKPYVGLAIVNLAGDKLDYYLDRSLTWERTCRSDGRRQVKVTITLHNGAPKHLPPYVVYRADFPPKSVRPGDNRSMVTYYATSGARLQAFLIDGKPVNAYHYQDRGHPIFEKDVEIPRGATRTIILYVNEPNASGAPLVLRQPLVRPLSVRLSDARCR